MKYAGDKSLELYGSKRGIKTPDSSTVLQVRIGIPILLASYSLMVVHLRVRMRYEIILPNFMSIFTGRMDTDDLS